MFSTPEAAVTNDPLSPRQPSRRIRDPDELRRIARALRREVVRVIAPTGQGGLRQGLGAADLFATIYFAELRFDVADPRRVDRDRFILSTAHNTAVFSATLAERGMLPKERPAGRWASASRPGSASRSRPGATGGTHGSKKCR
jgi:transketolase N-terminal domain/subunit